MKGAACRAVALLLQHSDHTQRADCFLQSTQTQVARVLPPGSRAPHLPWPCIPSALPMFCVPVEKAGWGFRVSLPMLTESPWKPPSSWPPGCSFPRDTALLRPPPLHSAAVPWAPLPMLSLQIVPLSVPSAQALSNEDGFMHCEDMACTPYLPQPLEGPRTSRLGTRR